MSGFRSLQAEGQWLLRRFRLQTFAVLQADDLREAAARKRGEMARRSVTYAQLADLQGGCPDLGVDLRN